MCYSLTLCWGGESVNVGGQVFKHRSDGEIRGKCWYRYKDFHFEKKPALFYVYPLSYLCSSEGLDSHIQKSSLSAAGLSLLCLCDLCMALSAPIAAGQPNKSARPDKLCMSLPTLLMIHRLRHTIIHLKLTFYIEGNVNGWVKIWQKEKKQCTNSH